MAVGSEHELRFMIRNLGSHPIHILGASSSCTCAVVGEKPREILPGVSRPIFVSLHVDRATDIVGRVTVYTDDPDHRELYLDLRAKGIAPVRGRPSAPLSTEQPKVTMPRL